MGEFRVLHLEFTKRRIFQTILDYCSDAGWSRTCPSANHWVSADSHFPELSLKFQIQGSMGEFCSPAMSELLQKLPSASSALKGAGQEFQRNFLGSEPRDLCSFIQNPAISVSASRGTSALHQLPWAAPSLTAQGCEIPPVSILTSILGICSQEQNILLWQQPQGNQWEASRALTTQQSLSRKFGSQTLWSFHTAQNAFSSLTLSTPDFTKNYDLLF